LLVWNDFLVASALLGQFEVGTAPVTMALADLVRSRGEDLQLLSAGTVVTIAVPLVVYAVLARWVTDGTRAATFDQ
jgi:ABC-type glycerol-3-phosphate transport system permease component